MTRAAHHITSRAWPPGVTPSAGVFIPFPEFRPPRRRRLARLIPFRPGPPWHRPAPPARAINRDGESRRAAALLFPQES